jgi:hypothetical protein
MSIFVSNNLANSVTNPTILVNSSFALVQLTNVGGFYNFSFPVAAQTDFATLSILISGLTNSYSTDEQLAGIYYLTSENGNSVDISPLTAMADTL